MADKKKKNFMQHDGVEIGYFDKRKKQFVSGIEQGFKNVAKVNVGKKKSKKGAKNEK